MEVYRSKYLFLVYWEEHNLMEMNWLAATENISEEEYKREFLNYLEKMLVYKPNKVIPDTRDFFFTVTIELQEWIGLTIFPPLLEMGLSKVAFVMAKELIAQLSIEQAMEEGDGIKFTTRYFDSKEEAQKWILSL